MNCRIVIGNVRFEHCHSVVIEEDATDIGDIATITLPRNIQKLKGKSVLEYISVGNAVKVEWGYNGKYSLQFEGYVRKIEAEAPIVVHCDDNWFHLKRNNHTKNYSNVTLKSLITDLAPGYEIDTPNIKLGKFLIDNESTYDVLKKIQRAYGLMIRLVGKKIVVRYSYKWTGDKILVYDRQKNVKESDLKYQRKEDVNVKIVVEYEVNGVKKVITRESVGKDLQIVKKETVNVALGQAEATELAEAKLNQYAFDGYTGSITGFGIPDTHAGDVLKIIDSRNADKEGEYVIEKMVATYEPNHISRQNYLSRKL